MLINDPIVTSEAFSALGHTLNTVKVYRHRFLVDMFIDINVIVGHI